MTTGTTTTTAAPATGGQAANSAPADSGAKAQQGAPMTEAGSKPTGKATDAAATPPPKTYEVKVNGKIQRMTEDEVLARARMAEAAEQRFNEAAKIKKSAEAAIGRIRDPEQMMDALMDPALGLSKDQIRQKFEEWYEREFIEPEKLTEDQKKLREAEKQIKKYADEAKQREQAKQQAEQEELTAKARGEIQQQIIEALETNALPKTNFTVRRLAYWIQRNQANGFNAPTSLLVSQVRNEFNSSMRDMVESADGEALVQLLGDGIIQKLRKYDLEQLRKMRGGGQVQADPGTQAPTGGNSNADKRDRPSSAEVTQKLRELQRTGRF
jgi:hypothetical protein